MSVFHGIFAARLILILGIVNFITAFLLLFTCRVIPAFKPTRGFMQHAFYKSFYRYHVYLWWIFWVSVVVHVVFAINYLGWPF